MSTGVAHELSHALNRAAVRRYDELAKLTGTRTLVSRIASRLALRAKTPYPYSFIDDKSLFPSSSSTFGRVIAQSRKAGLAEIHKSIGEQTEERAWLFIPDDEIWIDTTLDVGYASANPDRYAHTFLSYLYSAIEAVHTHPDAVVRHLAEVNPRSYSQNYLLEAARPSPDDLVGHYQMAARTAPSSRQVSSIVSHYGVTSFSVPESVSRSGGFRTETYDHLARDSSEPIEAIQALLGRVSAGTLRFDNTPAISLTFEPIR